MRAAPPMMLTTWPCDALSSGQNSRRQPHRAEELERVAVEPGLVRQFEEIARAGGARVVDQDVAALEALIDALEHLPGSPRAGAGRPRPSTARRRRPARSPSAPSPGARATTPPARSARPRARRPSRLPRPMPRLPPETTTTLSLNSPGIPFLRFSLMLGCYHARTRREQRTGMKSIFVDCNNQLDQVFARVHRTRRSADRRSTPRRFSRPTCLASSPATTSASTIIPTCRPRSWRECAGLKHIVFLGTGASSYMDVPALAQLGITVHTIKGYGDIAVAEHTVALMFAAARGLARMDRATRGRHLGAARRHAAAGQDARPDRARRHRAGSRAHRPRHRHGGDRLEPDAARRCRRAGWPISTPCWRPRT